MLEASLRPTMRGRVRVTAYRRADRAVCREPRARAPWYAACVHTRMLMLRFALAFMNERLSPDLPTVLLVTGAKNVWLSSTFVREAATLGRLVVPGAVPPPVEAALRKRFAPTDP